MAIIIIAYLRIEHLSIWTVRSHDKLLILNIINAKPLPMNLDRASPRIDPFVFLARADWVMQHFIKRNGVITSYQPCTLWSTLFQFHPEIILLVFQLKRLKIIQHFLSRSWRYQTLPSILNSKLKWGKEFHFTIWHWSSR